LEVDHDLIAEEVDHDLIAEEVDHDLIAEEHLAPSCYKGTQDACKWWV
jgi:hypothetical protein